MDINYEFLSYKLYVYYLAKTELYDRTLTDLRSPYNKTEAFTISPDVRKLSNYYAITINNYIHEIADSLKIPISYRDKRKEWNFNNYSAQHWIDEYNRLNGLGEYDFMKDYV